MYVPELVLIIWCRVIYVYTFADWRNLLHKLEERHESKRGSEDKINGEQWR